MLLWPHFHELQIFLFYFIFSELKIKGIRDKCNCMYQYSFG